MFLSHRHPHYKQELQRIHLRLIVQQDGRFHHVKPPLKYVKDLLDRSYLRYAIAFLCSGLPDIYEDVQFVLY